MQSPGTENRPTSFCFTCVAEKGSEVLREDEDWDQLIPGDMPEHEALENIQGSARAHSRVAGPDRRVPQT